MTFTENVMRRLFEKSPELKGTTFCGRTLIAKVDSQIIVKMTLVSTEKDNHLNVDSLEFADVADSVNCRKIHRSDQSDRNSSRFYRLFGDCHDQ